jgi:hypothetical protein
MIAKKSKAMVIPYTIKIGSFKCFSFFILWVCIMHCTPISEGHLPVLTSIQSPCKEGGEPNLFADAHGTVYLSWVEYLNDSTDALQFSVLENARWSEPKEVAQGNNWFVNWADFPSLVAYENEPLQLAAHWLEKSAPGTYDYDVRIAQSADGGKTWGKSFILHSDGVQAEHGFCSLVPTGDRIFAAWLDGRNTKSGEGEVADHDHGHAGPMTLRAAFFDKNNGVSGETELDEKVCDCCQTAAVATSKGLLVAYRDRSDKEIRDIFFVRQTADGWSEPRAVFSDNWKMTACPVNGPSLAAKGNTVVIAWYTAANDQPQVKLAFSNNHGESWQPPVRVDDGNPAGRVDVLMLSEKKAFVSWLENTGDSAEIRAVEVNTNGQKAKTFNIAKTSPSRKSGFPRMVEAEGKIVFAWTELAEEKTMLKSAILSKAN